MEKNIQSVWQGTFFRWLEGGPEETGEKNIRGFSFHEFFIFITEIYGNRLQVLCRTTWFNFLSHLSVAFFLSSLNPHPPYAHWIVSLCSAKFLAGPGEKFPLLGGRPLSQISHHLVLFFPRSSQEHEETLVPGDGWRNMRKNTKKKLFVIGLCEKLKKCFHFSLFHKKTSFFLFPHSCRRQWGMLLTYSNIYTKRGGEYIPCIVLEFVM